MTDFIHEQHEDQPEPPAENKEPIRADEQTGQKRVYGYIFILFIVAFSLLLWSYFMNQRSTDEVLSELRGNASSLQSTLDRNITLEERIDELVQKNDELNAQLQALRQESEAWREESQKNFELLQNTSLGLIAMDYLRGLETALYNRDTAYASACLERLEEEARPFGDEPIHKPLYEFLPTESTRKNPDGTEAEAPYAAFLRLRAELNG